MFIARKKHKFAPQCTTLKLNGIYLTHNNMKIRFLLLLTTALFVGCSSSDPNGNDLPDFSLPTPIPLADPYILYDNGMYYLYGTGSGDGIAVAISKDMKKWEWPENTKYYLALHKDDSYGTYYFWAPEVYKIGDKFLMYYSSQEHICAAWGESPLGPFKQIEKKPMREQKSIDNHLFIDDDGKPYLFWVHYDGGQQVWVAELEDDYMTIIPGTEKKCISPYQDWETIWATVNEGPFVLKHKGKYYLSYSANTYESQHYAVGYAVSDSRQDLGLCVREGAGFGLRCRIPVKAAGQGTPRFSVIAQQQVSRPDFCPLKEGQPFPHLALVRRSVLASSGGEIGILVKDRSQDPQDNGQSP